MVWIIIIMVLTSLIWWSLCIQSQIELEPQDFRTCTETFRSKSILLHYFSKSFPILHNFSGSWPQRSQAGSGDMETRGAIFGGFWQHTKHRIYFSIISLTRFTSQMPRRQSSSMLRFPIYFWASSPLVRFSICSGLNFQCKQQNYVPYHHQPYQHRSLDTS